VVVVGMPDERFGELPVACVQLRAAASTLSMQDLARLFETQGVTKKFWPADLHLVSEWPIGPTGKIDRRLVLEGLAKGRT
jgi:acyl-CoA synthetase (AMP-forming)/AMP-acid ligase II